LCFPLNANRFWFDPYSRKANDGQRIQEDVAKPIHANPASTLAAHCDPDGYGGQAEFCQRIHRNLVA